jgi:hypothetical protein
MHNLKNLRKKPLPYQRGGDFIDGHCIFFSIFFCLVMFCEPQIWSPMDVEKLWIINCMYINFIQFSSSNRWVKINFDSKWTLSSKMLSCKFLSFLLVFMIAKEYHQDFNLLRIVIFVIHHLFWWKVVYP